MWRLDNWIKDLVSRRYWVCNHHWCYRESTYDYRCPRHQDDP